MRILLVNDDGYQSNGLLLLCNKLAELGNQIFVVAPDGQRSGYSHSLSLHSPITIKELPKFGKATQAFSCSGTPADCVKFALHQVVPQCDLVISGPNRGENVGYDVIYSGTVAGAEEALIYNTPSIALSRWGAHENFDDCIDIFIELLPKLTQFSAYHTLINVNFPDATRKEIKGVKVCKQGGMIFRDYYVNKGNGVWQVDGDICLDNEHQTDAYWVTNNFVAITPIKLNQTNEEALSQLEQLISK